MKCAITIPSFTMTWFLAMNDYLMYSGDTVFVKEMFPRIKQMLECYFGTLTDGLLPCPRGKRYWQFYDWAEGLDGTEEGDYRKFAVVEGVRFDAPFNLYYIMVLQAAANMACAIGEKKCADEWLKLAETMKLSTHNTFWDSQEKAYKTYVGERAIRHYAELTQSLAILAGIGDETIHRNLRTRLMSETGGMTPTTLSQSLYKFEAILLDESCGQFVFEKIMSDWSKMLFAGATSFWETLNSGWDFQHAGSLCHGWSGIPVYFFGAYGLGIKPIKPGFQQVALKPILGLSKLEGTIPTSYGNIRMKLEKSNDTYAAHLNIPGQIQVIEKNTHAVQCEIHID
jgi:hypothetical protein